MIDLSNLIKVATMTFNFEDQLERAGHSTELMDSYEIIQLAQGQRLDSTRYDYEQGTDSLY
tara:strand:+ start:214 stop:396 length:183 start_codon:yes stop_codon:yes gene_type:complete